MRSCLLTGAASCLLGLTAAAGIQPIVRVQNPGGASGGQWARSINHTSTGVVLNPLQISRGRGEAIKPGTELRILCAGDSITVGTFSDTDGGDGNGYRLRLRNDLSADRVSYVGTVTTKGGNMSDGYFAAWPSKTIQYIADNIDPSLQQRPNVILLHAGTNDMNPNHTISTEGNDPAQAVDRLGSLVDRMIELCPDAVILVAMIINTCDPAQAPATHEFQSLIPGAVQRRYDAGHRVLAANFTSFPTTELRDCIHPTNPGYSLFGDFWYDFFTQIPRDWIQKPMAAPSKPKQPDSQPSSGESPSHAVLNRSLVARHALVASLVASLTILVC
ncbi:GDSL-like lipase/Acylhydrolase family protein [Hirsutella rhossiliensis]|uniref:GDSL-like lipase/Acylhydrolase family domain-containing protein n=1 Tax=Hirsutella rhossiliensis TaxID=111463 RepID=A0A9P8NBS5_9HYPO|nr:GDSL-like lipase/Acylhydrolase family domain-containing protein [Hirsutella rhossiliensis]KAH0968262.1 GDSL-like lipase/Acylhydrolase family domain-containing protein [Hirsutella rhossiliensis]